MSAQAELDILVHAKKIARVVDALHPGQAIVVLAVGSAHAITLVGGEEINVHASAREGRRGIEEVARPADAANVIGRVVPAAVDIHDELGLHLREVDDDAVVAHGIASDVVPAAANGEQQRVFPGEVHRVDDVRCADAAGDERLSMVAFQIWRAAS